MKEEARTTATVVCAKMREAILTGELLPGQKLAIDAMRARFGAGATPVREALNRLVSDGLVVFRDLRGFFVADLDEAQLVELFQARIKFFAFLLREAIAHGDGAWEEEVLVAFHRLSKTPWSTAKDRFQPNPKFAERLIAFYTALFSGCGSRWLCDTGIRLLHETDRFFWLVMKSKFETNRPGPMHRAIVDAVVARDAERAVEAITILQERLAETIVNAFKGQRQGATKPPRERIRKRVNG